MPKQIYSIGFPKIFSGSRINLSTGRNAIKANLTALLASDKGALFGDPYYGTRLKSLLWEQAYDPIIRDIRKEDVFEAIYSYIELLDRTIRLYFSAPQSFSQETPVVEREYRKLLERTII